MAEKTILSVVNLRKVHPPNKEVIRGLSLSFLYGAKIGVVGKNGTGKSSLLKILGGIDNEYFGERILDKRMKVGYLEQEPQLDPTLNVIDNIKQGMGPTLGLLARFEELSEKMGEDLDSDEMGRVMEEFGEVQETLDATDAWNLERTLEIAMEALGVPEADSAIEPLSGGERRRVALCRLLIEAPDLLLLDEPTNHLDAEAVAWLEDHLKSFKGTLITVTHDRYFLDNVTNWILEMEGGQGFVFEGNYSSWLRQKEQKLREAERTESKRQKTLKRELEWVRQGARGRQAKSKARLNAYENLLSQEMTKELERLEINIPLPPRLGERVVSMRSLSKSFGRGKTLKTLIDDCSVVVPRGAIVGIIGPNGVGKTTLFRMITGEEKPTSGAIDLGETVHLAYVGQFRDELPPGANVWEAISEGQEHIELGYKTMHSRAYVGSFGFKGVEQQKKVGGLSGGERNRVHLARLLKSGGNVLLLDEPTNDLDIDTLRSLEEALLSFAGCILIISHDRYFLDRVCTHILAYEPKGKLVFFQGNFTEYEDHKQEQLGEGEAEQKKARHKKLTR